MRMERVDAREPANDAIETAGGFDRERHEPTDVTANLGQDEVRRFFKAIPRDALRDRLLFGLTYRFGPRASEACELPAGALDRTRWEITIQMPFHHSTSTVIFRPRRASRRRRELAVSTFCDAAAEVPWIALQGSTAKFESGETI